MATKRVEKTGTYKHADGSSVYWTEGAEVDEALLDQMSLDADATKRRGEERGPTFNYGGIADAPQDVDAKATITTRAMAAGAPENKAAGSAPQRKADADAELADDAAKGKK